jgi:hypothetical protein
MMQRKREGVTVLCDTSAIEACFAKHPTDRDTHCAEEIANFKRACAEKSKFVCCFTLSKLYQGTKKGARSKCRV